MPRGAGSGTWCDTTRTRPARRRDASCVGGGPRYGWAVTGDMINFKGDWCAGTNNIAHAECSDAVRFTAEFAASSVLIK